MSLSTTERDLKRIFGDYGEIETVQLVYDRYSGRSRGFGFVYFQTTKEAIRVCFFFYFFILVTDVSFKKKIRGSGMIGLSEHARLDVVMAV